MESKSRVALSRVGWMHTRQPSRKFGERLQACNPNPRVACRAALGEVLLSPHPAVEFQEQFVHRPAMLSDWTNSSTSNQADPPPPQSAHLRKFWDRRKQKLFLFLSPPLSKQLPLVRQIAIRSFHTERFALISVSLFFHIFSRALGESPRTFVHFSTNGLRKRAAIEALRLISALPSSSSVFAQPCPSHQNRPRLRSGKGIIFCAWGPHGRRYESAPRVRDLVPDLESWG